MEKRYSAVIFDLDGTLINSLPYHFLAFKDLLLEHGIRVDDKLLGKLIGMPTADILKHLKKKYKFNENIADLREERRYHYFKFLGNRNIVFSGVVETLKKLRLDYKLAVATGSSKVIFSHSTSKDFQELFDFVVTINDVKKGKPYPEQFNFVAKKFRIPSKRFLVVGDSVYDAMAAKKAGMDFIGVSSEYNSTKELKKEGAIKVIKKISELKKELL
jgi:HAD superfamily hydrolase (TIGR01509 family)